LLGRAVVLALPTSKSPRGERGLREVAGVLVREDVGDGEVAGRASSGRIAASLVA
jgi:hypothetical protein